MSQCGALRCGTAADSGHWRRADQDEAPPERPREDHQVCTAFGGPSCARAVSKKSAPDLLTFHWRGASDQHTSAAPGRVQRSPRRPDCASGLAGLQALVQHFLVERCRECIGMIKQRYSALQLLTPVNSEQSSALSTAASSDSAAAPVATAALGDEHCVAGDTNRKLQIPNGDKPVDGDPTPAAAAMNAAPARPPSKSPEDDDWLLA